MIQYYHFHSSKGEYKDIISRKESVNRLKIFSELSALKRDGDTCFTYCPHQGECYFLQTDTTNNAFSHGLMGRVNELDTDPTLYIDRFDVKFSGKNEESIDDAPLPSGKPFDTSLYGTLPKMFGDVIETLLYSDKLVILFDASKDKLVNFIKALYRLLPNKYRRTIGFCVAPDSVEQFLPGVVTELFKNIRVIAVTSAGFYRQDNMAVFEFSKHAKSFAERHEYTNAIETYADYLACTEVSDFVNRVDLLAVNDEGDIDFPAMSGIAQTLLLKKDPSVENCIRALNSVHEYSKFDEALALAVKTLLSISEPSAATRALIEKAVSDANIKNTEGAASARATYGEYIKEYITDGSYTSDFMLDCFVAYFQKLSKSDINKFVENTRRCKRNTNSFRALVRLYNETGYPEILGLIVDYVDPNEIYDDNVDYSEDTFDDEKNIKAFTDSLFSVAASIENAEDAKRIVAALTVGCVRGKTSSDKRELRKEAIKTFLDCAVKIVDGKKTNKKLFSSDLERIEYLIELYDYYIQCVHILGEDSTRNESAIKELAEGLFGNLSSSDCLFSDCLYLYNKYPIIGFTCIKDIIYSNLSEFDAVKRNIFQGDNYIRYKKFVEKEEVTDKRISDFVLSITDEQIREARCKELDSFRQSFNNSCYKYVGPKATAWVIKEVNQVIQTDIRQNIQNRANARSYNEESAAELMNEELTAAAPFEKRLQKQVFCEKLFLKMGSKSEITVKNNSTERFRMFSIIAACCLACMLLMSLVFFVPQIVYAALLKCSITDRMLAMIDTVQILFIIYAGAVGVISGLMLWKYTRHDRPTSIKFCNLYMLAFAIVPALCYEIAFFVMYVM